jgi:hypothetical protein
MLANAEHGSLCIWMPDLVPDEEMRDRMCLDADVPAIMGYTYPLNAQMAQYFLHPDPSTRAVALVGFAVVAHARAVPHSIPA